MSFKEYIVNQKNNNDDKKEQQLIEDCDLNSQELINSLICTNIHDVQFIVLGNSLSSGYSMSDKIKPFFDQYDILKDQLVKNNINYNIYTFGLIAGNSNGNILNLLNDNKSIEYIKKVFAHDLDFDLSVTNNKIVGAEDIKEYKNTGRVPIGSIKEQDYNNFYKPKDSDQETRILDLLDKKNPGVQNIVILNGFTGELMDMIFRGGKIELLPKYLKAEFRNMYAILKTIIAHDDEVMIVVGAIPEYTLTGGRIPVLGPVISLYNRAIKENIQSTTNSYLTKPINIGILHNNEGHLIVDCHGNQSEYLALSNSFIQTTADNFLINNIFTAYNKTIKSYIESYNTEPTVNYSIDYGLLFGELNDILESQMTSSPKNNSKLLAGLIKFREYYNAYYHDDFFPTSKKEINNQLEVQKLILKKK